MNENKNESGLIHFKRRPNKPEEISKKEFLENIPELIKMVERSEKPLSDQEENTADGS